MSWELRGRGKKASLDTLCEFKESRGIGQTKGTGIREVCWPSCSGLGCGGLLRAAWVNAPCRLAACQVVAVPSRCAMGLELGGWVLRAGPCWVGS